MKELRKRLFAVSESEAGFDRRGFRGGSPAVRGRVEQIGAAVLAGYHAALDEDRPEPLAARLYELDPELVGFAFEGAAMSLALLDAVSPFRRDRIESFLAGPGAPHVYMVHVGIGWAMARLPLGLGIGFGRLDPMLRWLALDGYGFHEGFFHWPASVVGQAVPARVRGYARRVFDQGVGRSLWFVEGAEPDRIAATIGRFPEARRADLWSGVGLACCYAGGVGRAALETLAALAADRGGSYRPELAQGVVFAAKARVHAGNPTPHTDLACEVLTGRPAAAAASLADEADPYRPSENGQPGYEGWRRRIQSRFLKEGA